MEKDIVIGLIVTTYVVIAALFGGLWAGLLYREVGDDYSPTSIIIAPLWPAAILIIAGWKLGRKFSKDPYK